MIRVLLVEDSITQREILRRLLNDDGEFSVIAEARNGREAVEQVAQCRPDVVLMDIHMPDMNGVDATREIMRRFPVPIVIASATLKKREMDLGLEALKAGAVSVIAKPEGAALLHLQKIAPQLREELLSASKAKIRRLATPPSPPARPPVRPALRTGDIRIIGICVSTGGPPLLLEVFSAVPKPYPLPVLLVQHISFGFEEGFARWLGAATGQPVAMATDGQNLEPGVRIGPGGRHLALASRTRLELQPRKSDDVHCPSGDPLFESLGKHFGANAAGIVLTGMGDDGARGLLALKQAGGITIVQDEASSLIWGMPKAAKQSNAARHELSPEQIARVLTEAAESKFHSHDPTSS